jgi:hypothetical protein
MAPWLTDNPGDLSASFAKEFLEQLLCLRQ